jgi:hypothetical protein
MSGALKAHDGGAVGYAERLYVGMRQIMRELRHVETNTGRGF